MCRETVTRYRQTPFSAYTRISTKCGLAITSLTTMLERMENQGLISRVQSETDKRKTLLFLTEKARALKDEYDAVSDEMGSIYYKGLAKFVSKKSAMLNPIQTLNSVHYNPLLRKSEVLLNFAEAANEAWGNPTEMCIRDSSGTLSFT